MRRALNENPVVQAVVIGIMALAAAILLFTRLMGGDDRPAAGESAAVDAEAEVAEEADGVGWAAPASGAVVGTIAAAWVADGNPARYPGGGVPFNH